MLETFPITPIGLGKFVIIEYRGRSIIHGQITEMADLQISDHLDLMRTATQKFSQDPDHLTHQQVALHYFQVILEVEIPIDEINSMVRGGGNYAVGKGIAAFFGASGGYGKADPTVLEMLLNEFPLQATLYAPYSSFR